MASSEHDRTDETLAASSEQDRNDESLNDTVASSEAIGRTGAGSPRRPVSRGGSIGRYLVVDKLGAGGMGEVYAAYDPELDRRVAIKLLLERGDRGSENQARLIREARAMAQLSHPNVVTVHDVGTAEGRIYIAMEFVEGRTLGAWLSEADDRDYHEIVRVFIEAGRGLVAAHAKDLIHRDFKPDNVMVGADGRVLVMDFGLARSVADDPSETTTETKLGALRSSSQQALGAPLTIPGAMMGTPHYMAPEQWLGGASDARTDQFSYCVALYEALFGEQPFAGDSSATLALSVSEGELRPTPSNTKVPSRLCRAIVRGLATSPEDRWPSMTQLLTALDHDPSLVRRRWIGLSVVALLGIGVGVLTLRPLTEDASPACSSAGDPVDEVWNPATRTRVEAGLSASDLAYAEGTSQAVADRLEAYADSLRGEYLGACTDNRVLERQSDEMFDRRVTCLSRYLTEFDVTIEALSTADAEHVLNAPRVIAGLGDPGPCADPDRLFAAVAPPDPAARDEVAQVREQLARARAQGKLGDTKAALTLATSALARAREAGYRPLVAEALMTRADANEYAGQFEEARTDFEDAFFEARAAGHDEVSTDASTAMMFLLGEWVQDLDGAFAWSRHANAEVERRGTPSQRGKYHNNYGSLLHSRQDFDGSLDHHRQALEIWTQVYGEDSEAAASALNNIASVQFAKGEYDQSIEGFERVIAMRVELLGKDHPMVASAYSNLGAIQYTAGRYPEAEQNLAKALEMREALFPADHPDIASTLQNLSAVYVGLGRKQDALTAARRTLEILEKRLGADSPDLVVPLSNLAYMLGDADQLDEAEQTLLRAEAIVDAHPDVAVSLMPSVLGNLAAIQLAQGRNAEAVELHRQTLALLEAAHGPEHPSLLSPLVGISQALILLGDHQSAVAFARRATECADNTQADPSSRGDTYYILADALWAGDRREQSREAMRKSREIYASADPPLAESIAEVDAWEQERAL